MRFLQPADSNRLNAHDPAHSVFRLFASDGSCAAGRSERSRSPSRLTLDTAPRKVAAGGKYLTPALAERIATEIGSRNERPLHEMLSQREFQILKLIARGASLKDIAAQLHISAKTVTTYRARILDKTGLTSNAELTRYVVENDLLS